MNGIQKKQTIYINSKDRLSGTSSDFVARIEVDRSIAFDKISLINATIPRSFYNVTSRNNVFLVEENGQQRSITLPPANYSRKTIRNVVQSLLNTDSEPGYSYTVSIDSSSVGDTGKFTFTVTTSNPQPSFIFSSSSPVAELGFPIGTHAFVTGKLVAVNVANLLEKSRVIIRSNICQNQNNNVLQNMLATSGSSFDFINYSNNTPVENYRDFVMDASNIYTFTLYDENLDVLDLNGLNFSFTIMLWRESKILDMLKDFIQLKVALLDFEK